MADRLKDKRFRLSEPADGVVRVFCDVIVHRSGDEWIAISSEPGVAGETLMLDMPDLDQGGAGGRFPVCVMGSRPVIVEGRLRHRIRLQAGPRSVLFEQQVRR